MLRYKLGSLLRRRSSVCNVFLPNGFYKLFACLLILNCINLCLGSLVSLSKILHLL